MRLAAGLRPDPLGELKRSPDPLATKGGLLLRVGGRKGGEGRGGKGKEREGKGREERGGARCWAVPLFNWFRRLWVYCTNQTKRLMEKTKKKTIEQSGVRKDIMWNKTTVNHKACLVGITYTKPMSVRRSFQRVMSGRYLTLPDYTSAPCYASLINLPPDARLLRRILIKHGRPTAIVYFRRASITPVSSSSSSLSSSVIWLHCSNVHYFYSLKK